MRGRPWDSGAVYTGGDLVSYQDTEYRAKWWTTGEEPGTTGQWGVWRPSARATAPGRTPPTTPPPTSRRTTRPARRPVTAAPT
ncbi:hypothetical protein GCM10029992_13550 [Glycomyces albus]